MHSRNEKTRTSDNKGAARGPSAGATRKERERARHRREILDAAERLFAEKGFHGATTEEIARRAEFAVGTLYKFFKSKEEIYNAVLLEGMCVRRDAIRKLCDNADLSPTEVLRRYFDGKALFAAQRADFMKLLLREHFGGRPLLSPESQVGVLAAFNEGTNLLTKVIEKGIRRGEFRALPPRETVLALEGITSMFLRDRLHESPGTTVEERVALVKSVFFNGILSQPGS